MRNGVRILVVALVVVAVVGGVVAWSGVLAPRADSPVRTTTQVFPSPEQWPGIRWTRVDEPALEAASVWISNLVTHGPLIVGWGESSIPDPADENGFLHVSTLWTSHGGVGWQRHELKLLSGEPFWPQALAVGPVGLLAFGLKGDGDKGNAIPVAALSADGQRWVEAGRPPLELGSLLVATETGFVTAGLDAGRVTVLFTADGVTWVEMTVPAGLGEYQLSDIRRTPSGVVVAGTVMRGPDWDGVIWQGGSSGFEDLAGDNPMFVGLDRGVGISRTVPFAAGIFALGIAGEFPDCALAGRVASLGPIIADTCAGPPQAAWVSADGHRWQEVEGPRPPGRAADGQPVIVSMAAGAAGLVAIVEEALPGHEQGSLGTWTSRDGVEWLRVGDGLPLGPGTGLGPMVVLPGRIVAVVPTESGITVWLGTPDG